MSTQEDRTDETQREKQAENQQDVESSEPDHKSGVGWNGKLTASPAEYAVNDRVSFRGTKNGAYVKVNAIVIETSLNRSGKWEYRLSGQTRWFSENELSWV